MTDTDQPTTDRHAVDYGRPGTHLAALAATIADMSTAVEEARDVMRRAVAEKRVMQSAIHELIAAHSVKHVPGIPGYENLTGFSRCECGGDELPCPARAGLERILDPDGKAIERVLAYLYRPADSTFEEAFARWRADGAPDVPPEVDTALRFAQAEDCTGGRACSSVVHVEGCFSEAWSDDEIKRCVWSLAELARRDGPACLTPCEDCRDEAPAAADGDVS